MAKKAKTTTKTITKKPARGKTTEKKEAAIVSKPTRKAFPLVSRNDLMRVLEQCSIYQNRASTATGDMGDLIREYSDRKNLHTGAFALIKRLYLMGQKDRGKLWLLLAHFDDMRNKCGLDRLAEEQGQLLPPIAEDERGLTDQEAQPEAEPAEAEVEAGNENELAGQQDWVDEGQQPQPLQYPRAVDEQAGQEHAA